MIRRTARTAAICVLLPLAGCGYFSDNSPTLEQDPLPERSATPPAGQEALEEPPLPDAGNDRPAIETRAQAANRLTEHEEQLAALEEMAQARLSGVNADPQTHQEWGQAQIDASRLTRIEGDLRALADRVNADAGSLARSTPDLADEATAFRTLARRIQAVTERVQTARQEVQTRLANERPDDPPAPERPETPLPEGRPALSISADARAETYSRAVTTLVEKAQAINSTNVYHVVAAADDKAAMRAGNVRSLLAAAGVADTRIRMLTDPAGEAGNVRIFVE